MKVEINGTGLYYVKRGHGPAFVLLHGNGQDHTIYRALIRRLSKIYTVYAVDSRGHGKSRKVSKLNYMDIMKDFAQFISELELEEPILYGFSDGGIIGLLLAIHYPHLISKLIISGANTNPDGIKTFYRILIKIGFFFTRSIKLEMMLTQPDISNEQLSQIVTPTLILAGSRDVIRREHTMNIAANIPGSIFEILDGEGHGSYIVSSDTLYFIMKPFLDGILIRPEVEIPEETEK